MSNYIAKTNAASSQPQSWLSRIGQAFREAFSSHEVPEQKKAGTDTFMRGAPLSVAASRRIGALTSGRGSDGTRGANSQGPSRDAYLISVLNTLPEEMSKLDHLTRRS